MDHNSVFIDVMNLSGLGELIENFLWYLFITLGLVISVLLLIALFYIKNQYNAGEKSKRVYTTAIIMNIVFDVLFVTFICFNL